MNVNAAEFDPPLHVLRVAAPPRVEGGLDGADVLALYQRRTLLLYLRAYATTLTAGELFLLRTFLAAQGSVNLRTVVGISSGLLYPDPLEHRLATLHLSTWEFPAVDSEPPQYQLWYSRYDQERQASLLVQWARSFHYGVQCWLSLPPPHSPEQAPAPRTSEYPEVTHDPL